MKMKMKMKVNDCVRKEGSDSMAPDGKRITLDDLSTTFRLISANQKQHKKGKIQKCFRVFTFVSNSINIHRDQHFL